MCEMIITFAIRFNKPEKKAFPLSGFPLSKRKITLKNIVYDIAYNTLGVFSFRFKTFKEEKK